MARSLQNDIVKEKTRADSSHHRLQSDDQILRVEEEQKQDSVLWLCLNRHCRPFNAKNKEWMAKRSCCRRRSVRINR